MTITATKQLDFDYGHRVLGHGGKCRHIHGHRGVALVTVQAAELDGLGMVIDFGDIKQLVGKWIDDHWDHNLLLHPSDPLMTLALEDGAKLYGQVFQQREPFIMPNGNPTAENMASVLFHEASRLLHDSRMQVVEVKLYETPTSYATITRGAP